MQKVNPARAGMIRMQSCKGRTQKRKPRASGDDPSGLIVLILMGV